MKFQESTVIRFSFTQQQIKKNLESAFRDYDIARKDCILEVKFTYRAPLKIHFFEVKIRFIEFCSINA